VRQREPGEERTRASKGRGCRCGVRHGMHGLGFIIGDGGGGVRFLQVRGAHRPESLLHTLSYSSSTCHRPRRAGLGWAGLGWPTASAKRLSLREFGLGL
jgi:hypothetical protein